MAEHGEPASEDTDGAAARGKWRSLLFVGLIWLASFMLAHLALGVLGPSLPVNANGFPPGPEAETALFRFDSFHYRDIAVNGYHYNGDPFSTPNIVFAPLYPFLIRAAMTLSPLSPIGAGFIISHVCFLLGLWVIFLFLSEAFSRTVAVCSVIGLAFSPGSFAFHAYYSESVGLLFLALSFLGWQRQWRWRTAAAVALLGLSRVSIGPLCGIFALAFAIRAIRQWRKDRRVAAKDATASILCVSGSGLYLLIIWAQFGNPFVLLPELQTSSWQELHKHVPLPELLILKPLFTYVLAVLQRGLIVTDIRLINLVLMWWALASVVYGFWRWRDRPVFLWGFATYFALVYVSVAGAPELVSSHRHLVVMLPMFVALVDGTETLRARAPALAWLIRGVVGLWCVFSYLVCVLFFSRGYWFYF
jgi:hypothetical protein